MRPSLFEQSALLETHAHNGPMDDLGDRFVECFAAAIDDVDAVVPARAPIPRWGWDGLEQQV
jgi:hemoglobin